AAFAVLSSAIDWPASLDLPAAEALPLVAAEESGILLGYSFYLAFSLGIASLAVLLPRAYGWRPGAIVTLVVVAGALSAAFRAIGIGRWLLAMPALADGYLAAAPGSASREAAVVVHTTLNDYLGGVGEVLGVSLTGAAFAALASIALLRHGGPQWLAILGLVTAATLVLAAFSEVFLTVGPTLLLGWLIALGGHLLRVPPPGVRTGTAVTGS
ncbi:MAG: DUF4386 family protein, partial [Actinomycetales bacterium]